MTPYNDPKCGDARVALPLFQQECGGSIPTSPLQLRIYKISISTAKILNRCWHSRLPIYETGFCLKARVCFGALYDGLYYAIAIWDNPTARILPQDTFLELKRFAIAPDAPKNTASRMISIMTIFIKQQFPEVTTLISYQDTEAHKGTIYKASGWKPTLYRKGGSWWRPNQKRFRPDLNKAIGPKIRWEKELN